MVKNIIELRDFLREKLGSRLEVISFINTNIGKMIGIIDKEPFTIMFNSNEALRFTITPNDDTNSDISDIRKILLEAMGKHKDFFGYRVSKDDESVLVLEWIFKNTKEYRKRLLNRGVSDLVFYHGESKEVPSLIAQRNGLFAPLPKEQRLTEEKLIRLERRIARAAAKNERILVMSEINAIKSPPCGGEIVNDDEKTYVKTK